MGDLSVRKSFSSLSQLADVSNPSLFETWRINEEGLEKIGLFENITEKFKGILAFLGFNYINRTDDRLIKERFKEILSKDSTINGSNWAELVPRAAYKVGLAKLNSKNSKLELDRSIQTFVQELLDKKNDSYEKENSLATRRSSDATVIPERILNKVNDVYRENSENNASSLESSLKENYSNGNGDLELLNIQKAPASVGIIGLKSEKKNEAEILTTENEVKVTKYYLDDLNEAKLNTEQHNNTITTQEVAKDLKILITNAYNYRRSFGLGKDPILEMSLGQYLGSRSAENKALMRIRDKDFSDSSKEEVKQNVIEAIALIEKGFIQLYYEVPEELSTPGFNIYGMIRDLREKIKDL